MQQGQARDEAGYVWNLDANGNAVGPPVSGPGMNGNVVAPNPVQAQRQTTDLTGAQLGNQKTAQQIALEAAQVPYAPRQAAAETTKAENEAAAAALALQKAQREASLPVSGQVGRANLQRAIDDIRSAYAAGPARTSGIGGLADYLPSTVNQQFDAAGNSVRGFVGPALGLTGGQLNTEKEAQRAVGPYIPQASDRDDVIEDKIRRLQGLADAMGGVRRQATAGQAGVDQRTDALAAMPGNIAPGLNASSVAPVTGGSGGGNFTDAAGIKMAQLVSETYNRGGRINEINKVLLDNGYQPYTDPKEIEAINRGGPRSFAPPQVDDTRGAVGQALGSVADSAGGAYAISAADALTAGTLDNIAGGQSALAMEYAREQSPTASLLGSITGGALAAGGAELGLGAAGLSAGRAALAGDALYGGAYAAGSADGGQSRLAAAGLGGALGLGGGIAGRAAARGIGGTLTGVQDANVRGLRAAGVPLTAGQAIGGVARGVEDRLTGIPVVGSVVNARRLEGMQGFNRAAFDEALQPIGANTGGVTGEAGIDAARRAVGGAYDTALSGVQVRADAPFIQDMGATIARGQALPEPMAGRADYTLNTRVGNSFGPNGELSGRDFQQSVRGLDRDAAAVRNEPYGYDFGEVTGDARGALEGMLTRQAPDVLPAYNNASQAFRRTEVLRDAVNRARNGTRVGETGTFAPSQLSDAAAANARRFGNSQGTTRQPFFDLTRAGQAVLPNTVPDSGTAGRLAVQGGLGALGLGAAGGTGYATGGEEGAGYGAGGALAIGGLLAAGGTRTGQRALTAALLNRNPALVNAGNAVLARSRIGGLFGAPMLAGAAPMLLPAQ